MGENYDKCEVTIKFICVFCRKQIIMSMTLNELSQTIMETGETDPPSTGCHIYCPKCKNRNYFKFEG